MRKVYKIEPTLPIVLERKKVAAYARVSKETVRLTHSISAQVSYYRTLIQSNPEWEYAGVYADCGITGTLTSKRIEFQRMLTDCKAGKIQIILTKSIARFARNTVDLLETVRYLKTLGIEVRFEKEHIFSLSEEGELMLSLLASFAQEESRSISENSKWGIRKRYETGEIGIRNKRVFGYQYNGKEYQIVPEEAELVRLIFARFLSGVSIGKIRSELNETAYRFEQRKTFSYSTIRYMLQNEIYIGDRKYQKYFTDDLMKKKKRKNNGQLPQYYIKEDHIPIISRETFAAAQAEIERRKLKNPVSCFSKKIVCEICTRTFTRKKITRKGKDIIYWICSGKKKTGSICSSINFKEETIKQISAYMMEREEFDEIAFYEQIERIVVLKDGSLEYSFYDGRRKQWQKV